MKKSSTGFTLIELMIVIAIIGILMAYAVPAYRDYTTRSKAGECVSIMNSAKVSISERWNATTSLALITDNPSALISNSITGANVGSVVVTAPGIITCTYASSDSDLNGETIILTPTGAIGSGSLTWLCTHSAGLAIQHVPGGC